jgi:peptidyl-dipeptidase A
MVVAPEGRDAPDWASKIHVVSAPVYYHNYMLGELLASQLHHSIQTRVLRAGQKPEPLNDRREVGDFLRSRIFRLGKRLRWDQLVYEATGMPLDPEHFVRQFV